MKSRDGGRTGFKKEIRQEMKALLQPVMWIEMQEEFHYLHRVFYP